MSFLDKLKPTKLPKSLDPNSRREAERLITELIGIGQKDSYLSEHPGGLFDVRCHNIEARRIGKRLNELGGLELMMAARQVIHNKLGMSQMSHLDYAWLDIGEWKP
jgi:hypothetical protein